jgi:hypothetical protein
MRKILNINDDWLFVKKECDEATAEKSDGEKINLPYTWNGIDGQDGGGDYLRAAFWFVKKFAKPNFTDNERVYIEFKGVNSSAEVWLNGKKIAAHDGGYSTFRKDITDSLLTDNVLCVLADNKKTETVYPQTADFTFYGGIYRDVNLIITGKNHFDLDYFGAPGIAVTPTVHNSDGEAVVKTYVTGEGDVKITICDASGMVVANGENTEKFTINNVHLWNGIADPYLYTAKAELILNGEVVDNVQTKFGFRTFSFDAKKGFILNGKPYRLNGVSRHQDRPKIGNALTKANHEEDIKIIKEIGANSIRLAHYQHDDYFYDLCDEAGFVVWAEIPYISRHMPEANDNALSQMKELIYQQYNHSCIVMWGISNEITMYHKHKKDMLAFHHKLNNMVKELDPTRTTTLACYASCGFFNKAAHITDVVGWNLYLGWYTPFLWLNDVWLSFFHLFYKKRCLCYSEYGAEAMPNLHSKHPRRGDNSEEYQTIYHEYMLRFFNRHPYIWGTYVWNMFDFAADARNQGGEPGMNHKGLVTFDRQTKKDSFYLYKAYWAEDKFVHIAGKRFANRTGKTTKIKVYTNAENITFTHNGKVVKGKTKDGKVYEFAIKLESENIIKAESGNVKDECIIKKVDKPDPDYKLHVKSETQSWQK